MPLSLVAARLYALGMNIKPVAVVALASLALAACGGGEPEGGGASPAPSTSQVEGEPTQGGGGGSTEGEPAGGNQGAPGMDYPVEAGGEYTYPDGLEVQVGDWQVEGDEATLHVTATNPTGEAISTSQAWVVVRAGETGEQLEEWAEGEPLDAVLQPDATATGEYVFTAPETPGHVVALLQWHESDDPVMRYDTLFAVSD